jgi:hypothetical protein
MTRTSLSQNTFSAGILHINTKKNKAFLVYSLCKNVNEKNAEMYGLKLWTFRDILKTASRSPIF